MTRQKSADVINWGFSDIRRCDRSGKAGLVLNLVNQTANSAMIVVEIFVCLIIILVEIPLHECAHGWAAKALGDPTPYRCVIKIQLRAGVARGNNFGV